MGLPTREDNAIGYDRSRLSTLQDSFRNKTYLLVHGSLDDNVHYQQSMALARTLEISDVPFDQIVSINFIFICEFSVEQRYLKIFLFVFLITSASYRHIQMKIIPCGEFESICIMPLINTLPNVL